MSDPTANTESRPEAAGADIVARGGRYYRWARFFIALLFFAYGMWCIRDGFFKYPRENEAAIQAEIDRIEKTGEHLTAERRQEIRAQAKQPHGPPDAKYDVPLNRGLACLLPPVAILVLIRTLYRSRGEIRLSGDALSVPGHGAIPLDSVRKIDKRLWERKGIALVEYEQAGGPARRFRLDDFVYERDPIDRILERIEAHVRAAPQGGEDPR